jgi:hypothetical protein
LKGKYNNSISILFQALIHKKTAGPKKSPAVRNAYAVY